MPLSLAAGGVTISAGCTGETAIAIVKPGATFRVTLDQSNTSSLCGQLAASTAADCATPASNACVFSAEAK